ncbi:glycosyltransferase [Paenibacillus sp. SYP-B3998]|uniref:Glycosyltransferase n=1 Tax=Paenibacillus sp. SYP-B3998 TaxID=2678564 RepID=A0A6G3ZYG5_9BACL|nr:glycosyltransferase [Paenibacillus sp. SYP-B3998]NEW07155.1 glycosyltransferase [Paenibacillus sp. SYP-B3998]
MKILHVLPHLATRYGGPVKAGIEMASSLVRLGHEVSIFTTNIDGPGNLDVPLDAPVFKNGVEIRYFPVQQPRFWHTSLALARALKKEIPKYDIVHIHSLYLFHSLVTGHYCRKFNVPYIVRPHGTLDPFMYKRHRLRKSVMEVWFENNNIKKAAALHYTAAEEMTLAEPVTFNAPGFVVPNGLNVTEYDHLPAKGSFRQEYPELEGKKIILFFSRINFKKGLDILIEAFHLVHQKHEDTVLVITGPDNEGYGDKVREWIQAKHLTDKVIFTGMLTGDKKLAVLRDADLFALPSYSENFGIAVVEAMACGVPVVISDKINIWREVVANQAGSVSPCDPVQFAKEMNVLLEDQQLSETMGINGQNMVRDYYQWDKIGLSLEKEYTHILHERNRNGLQSAQVRGDASVN